MSFTTISSGLHVGVGGLLLHAGSSGVLIQSVNSSGLLVSGGGITPGRIVVPAAPVPAFSSVAGGTSSVGVPPLLIC